MTDSLSDLLKKRGHQAGEPEEFLIIRKFVQDRYSVTPALSISKGGIAIGVPSSAIAGNLRFDLYDIQNLLKDNKRRLFVRIVH